MEAIIVGLTLILCSFVVGFSGLRFILTSKTTTGNIIRINSTSDHDNGLKYRCAPVVRYYVGADKPYVYESSVYSEKYCNSVGDDIVVRYSSSDPDYAYAGKLLDYFLMELTIFFLGASILLIGIYA